MLWLDGQTGGSGLNKAACFDSITVAATSAPPTPIIAAPVSVCPTSVGNSASISNPGGCAYAWAILGGTITGGATSSTVTFTAGAGPSVTLLATQSANGATSPQGSKVVPVTSTVAADFDQDCDVDLADLAHLVDECMAGPKETPLGPNCQSADLDGDSDVDQADFGLFQRCYSGENNPANPACTQ